MDTNFKALAQTANMFGYQVDVSLFARAEQTVYLHCSLLICKVRPASYYDHTSKFDFKFSAFVLIFLLAYLDYICIGTFFYK